jgi:hypothetical protein
MKTTHITFETPAFVNNEDLLICVKCAPNEKSQLTSIIYDYDSNRDNGYCYCYACHTPLNEI